MLPRVATVVLLVALSLVACSEPAALRESETRPAGANQPGTAQGNPAKRPVETLGPDDAVVRSVDATAAEPTGVPALPPAAPAGNRGSPSPPPE